MLLMSLVNDFLVHVQRSQTDDLVIAGFGLGALNDADEDDLDVYDSATSKSRLRTAYDVTDTDTERVLLGSGANRYDRPKQTSEPRPLKPETVSGETSFHKGRPVLAGFMLAEKPVMEDQWFVRAPFHFTVHLTLVVIAGFPCLTFQKTGNLTLGECGKATKRTFSVLITDRSRIINGRRVG